MRVLLDTQVLLWLAFTPRRVTTRAMEMLGDSNTRRVVSVASVWELSIKTALGKLDLRGSVEGFVAEQMEAQDFDVLPVSLEHALRVAALPAFPDHRDPFDRLLAAQALVDGVPVVTADANFERYGLRVIW